MPHEIHFTIDPVIGLSAEVTCTEPPTAMCRTYCSCDVFEVCEDPGCNHNLPEDHCIYGHPRQPMEGDECNIALYLNEDGDPADLYDGAPHAAVDGEIVAEWSRYSSYVWHYDE